MSAGKGYYRQDFCRDTVSVGKSIYRQTVRRYLGVLPSDNPLAILCHGVVDDLISALPKVPLHTCPLSLILLDLIRQLEPLLHINGDVKLK
jgi:hypothetical protein